MTTLLIPQVRYGQPRRLDTHFHHLSSQLHTAADFDSIKSLKWTLLPCVLRSTTRQTILKSKLSVDNGNDLCSTNTYLAQHQLYTACNILKYCTPLFSLIKLCSKFSISFHVIGNRNRKLIRKPLPPLIVLWNKSSQIRHFSLLSKWIATKLPFTQQLPLP